MIRGKSLFRFLIVLMSINFIPVIASGVPRAKPVPPPPPFEDTAPSAPPFSDHDTAPSAPPWEAQFESSDSQAPSKNRRAKKQDSENSEIKGGKKRGDLTKAELDEFFFDFSVNLEGEEPHDKVVTSGLVFDECNRYFQFKKEMHPEGASCKNAVGFRIVDQTGEGRKCVLRLKKAKKTCENTHCARFSVQPYTSINLSTLKEDLVEVKLVYTDLMKDRDRNQCVDFGDKALTHRSQNKIDEEARLAEEAKLKNRSQSLAAAIGHCADMTAIDSLRKENQELLGLNAITEEIFSINSKALDKKAEDVRVSGLTGIFNQILAAPKEELSIIREKLISWASDYPQDLDHVIEAFRMVAHRYTESEMANSEDWTLAIQAISEARSLSGLTQKHIHLLEQDLTEAKTMQIVSMANNGWQNNPSLRTALYRELPQAQRDVMQKCYYSRTISMETCAPSMQKLQLLQSLPQRAQEADMRNYQNRMNILMQLQQNPGSYGNMPGTFGGPQGPMSNFQMMGGMPGMPTGNSISSMSMNPMGNYSMGGYPMMSGGPWK